LQTSIKNLIQKDILDKKEKYYFQDPVFEYWLKKHILYTNFTVNYPIAKDD